MYTHMHTKHQHILSYGLFPLLPGDGPSGVPGWVLCFTVSPPFACVGGYITQYASGH